MRHRSIKRKRPQFTTVFVKSPINDICLEERQRGFWSAQQSLPAEARAGAAFGGRQVSLCRSLNRSHPWLFFHTPIQILPALPSKYIQKVTTSPHLHHSLHVQIPILSHPDNYICPLTRVTTFVNCLQTIVHVALRKVQLALKSDLVIPLESHLTLTMPYKSQMAWFSINSLPSSTTTFLQFPFTLFQWHWGS